MAALKRTASPSLLDEQRLMPAKSLRSKASSNLTDQIQRERDNSEALNEPLKLNVNTPTKIRSVSDVAAPPPLLSSPKFLENSRTTRDDISVTPVPSTPRRPSLTARGLSLQMPSGDLDCANRTPLSPKLDSVNTYGAAASVLPRRSRGLDFSRACTNLHHSTLADQSSPDSSPIMTGRGMTIPARKGMPHLGNSVGSPGSNAHSLWSTLATSERHPMASSMGSVTMMDSDSLSSSSSDDDLIGQDEVDDPIITTPQVYKIASGNIPNASPGGDWLGNCSPAAASLMSFQRARLRKGRSRKSSSSASLSGGSSTPASPPVMKSVESGNGSIGYFAKELAKSRAESRRSSLNWGTRELQISGGDSDDGREVAEKSEESKADEKHKVIQRPVTRRGNLMPKTKHFARIHAALMEEGAPIDTEVRREAEVVRQVRESDVNLESIDKSPSLLPTVPGLQDSLEDIPEDHSMAGQDYKRRSGSFSQFGSAKAGSKEFWESFRRLRTTPPPPLFSRADSSALSDDTGMEAPLNSSTTRRPPPLHLNTESQSVATLPSALEITQKINNKRRRDDDFDVFSFKRRAVSPSMSVQNSPILQQSPAQKDPLWLSKPPRELGQQPSSSLSGPERGNSGSSSTSASAGPKRIGLQGMVDTNDAIMKMSIE